MPHDIQVSRVNFKLRIWQWKKVSSLTSLKLIGTQNSSYPFVLRVGFEIINNSFKYSEITRISQVPITFFFD